MNQQASNWYENEQGQSQFVPSGEARPIAGRVVSMVDFRGRILVATEYHVYELIGDELVQLKFKDVGERL